MGTAMKWWSIVRFMNWISKRRRAVDGAGPLAAAWVVGTAEAPTTTTSARGTALFALLVAVPFLDRVRSGTGASGPS
jgi:hypothetical protein